MKRAILALLFLFSFIVPTTAARLGDLSFAGRQLTAADGLAANSVQDIVQDGDGFVWFATPSGLSRYDGYRFVNFAAWGGGDSNVGNLYDDRARGLLWVHTATYHVACYDRRAARFVDYTGRGDEGKSFRKLLPAPGGVWLYDPHNGARHIVKDGKGNFACTDYTAKGGALWADHVSRIVVDGAGNAWILTNGGLTRIDRAGKAHKLTRGNYTVGNCLDGRLVALAGRDRAEMYDGAGRLQRTIAIPPALGRLSQVFSDIVWQGRWLVFGPGTYAFDFRKGRCEKPANCQVRGGILLESIDGFHFESDAKGGLWLFPPKGDPRELRLMADRRFTFERRRLYSVARAADGLFHIATYGGGLFVYDYPSGSVRHLSASDAQSPLDTDMLLDIVAGDDGTLWVAQETAGVAQLSVSSQQIGTFVQPMPGRKGDWANQVRMVARDADGSITLSTRDNRLHSFNPATGTLAPKGETPSCVYAMLTDRRGRKWVATRSGGLYIDGTHYDRTGTPTRLPSRNLVGMAEDGLGRVWIATAEDGLMLAEDGADGRMRFTQLLRRSINEGRVRQVATDGRGRLWVATNGGLYMADSRSRQMGNGDFRLFATTEGLPFSEVHSLCVARDGALWIGGKGGGVARCSLSADGRRMACRQVTTAQGLASDAVSSLVEDRWGNVWVATESGLSVIYGKELSVKTYMFGQTFARNAYSPCAALSLDDGRLLLGTQDGLAVVTPPRMDAAAQGKAVRLCVTDLLVNGRSLAGDSLAPFAPGHTRELTLAHTDNTLTFLFSNFAYADLRSSAYQHYLEGYDRGWLPASSVARADYANLAPGTYTLHLRSRSGKRWSDEQTLRVTIRQPWHNTWWAWTIYIVVVAAILSYIVRGARERLRLHQQMQVDRQLTEFRLQFFTHIAHEFRTPLAVIQGAVEQLREEGQGQSRTAVQTARRGTRRLLRLVNQLMEFRRVSTGHSRLQVEQGDIVAFVRGIYQDFWNLGQQKEMRLSFTPFERKYTVPFDRRMVETMVYNLLSNAVKYAPQRGEVAVTLRHEAGTLVLAVADNGPGMGEEQLRSLFQPFMRGNVSQGGMGIGLYTAHRMAGQHHGRLVYQRAGEDGGSVFTLTLPDADVYAEEEHKAATATATLAETTPGEAEEPLVRELPPRAYNDVTVAVVEDDPDMMEQVSGVLAQYFHIDKYMSGEAALEGMKEHRPALVVCDVMLPGIDGYEVVRRLRKWEGPRVPVVMLTALDDDAHQLRSYKADADDYMGKPCNFKLLVARCAQLICPTPAPTPVGRGEANKKPLPTGEGTGEGLRLVLTQADKLFKDKMAAHVAQHIADPAFTVDQLAQLMGMGRTKFFAKAKELLGVSPNKYLQNERMRLAADLLADGELTVAEVAYRVGMQDTSYFNKCFKAAYGVPPSKYARAAGE